MNNLKNANTKNVIYTINSKSPFSILDFQKYLFHLLKEKKFNKIVFLCIGTDKSTGDSLGPIIGYKLLNLPLPDNIKIFGTLKNPVHAKNLKDTIKFIKKYEKDCLIIAIDASLGETENIGYINIGEGGIKPGAGIKKNLPYVGDMFITGIVNSKGILETSLLQNTRLYIVMQMADIISTGIWHCINLI